MAWLLEIQDKDGNDLYPEIRKRAAEKNATEKHGDLKRGVVEKNEAVEGVENHTAGVDRIGSEELARYDTDYGNRGGEQELLGLYLALLAERLHRKKRKYYSSSKNKS